MKQFLFNLYKTSYLVAYNQNPKIKPFFLGNLMACAGVFGFFFLVFMNLHLIIISFWGSPQIKIDKPLMWGLIIVAFCLTYLLLFKVLGLKNHNYYEPEYKPDAKTIKKITIAYAINGGITFLFLIFQLVSAFIKEM